MASIKSLKSLTLDLPPSCIEFWPTVPEYAVVGTYYLDKAADDGNAEIPEDRGDETKKSQTRNGSLILVQVDGDDV